MYRRTAPTLTLALLSGACSLGESGGLDRPAAEVSDSAGVTIVRSQRPPPGSRLDWTIGGAPLLSVGTLDGDAAYQLFRVSDATRLPDGRIAVANQGTSQIRIYDAVGTHLESWGREGEGPGEFTLLTSVYAWPGDSVMAFDQRQGRFTVFDGDGNLGRTVTLEQDENMRFATVVDVFADGRPVTTGGTVFTAGEDNTTGLQRRDQAYAVIGVDGKIAQRLGMFPGSEAYMVTGDGFMMVSTHPFARRTRADIWEGGVLIATNDTYELRLFGPGGGLQRIVRRDHELIPVKQEHLDANYARQREEMDEDQIERMRDVYENMPLIPHFPAYGNVEVDALGHLWVEEYELPGQDLDLWTVFDSSGAVLGLVELPDDLRIYEIGADYILGRATDDFDVEYVRMYGLMRPTRRASASGA